jgi:hypothetical protein
VSLSAEMRNSRRRETCGFDGSEHFGDAKNPVPAPNGKAMSTVRPCPD